MSFEAALTFLLAIFIFGITPGPGVFAILARSLMSGAKACWPLALGMAVSDVVYLILACMGLASIAENWGELFTAIRWTGAAYLVYLGWKMWTAAVDTEFNDATSGAGSWANGFMQGFLISASNPKVILFYIAFLPTFMDLQKLSRADIVLASILTLIALIAGLMLIAVSAARSRRHLRSTRSVRRLNRTAGGIMIGAGAYLASR